MMNDILQVPLFALDTLQNDLHLGFVDEVSKRTLAFRNGGGSGQSQFPTKVDALWLNFTNAVANEDWLYLLATRSEYTQRILEKDEERDGLFKQIRTMVNTMAALTLDPDRHVAAQKMQPVMQKYRIDTSASYEAETVTLGQWLQEMGSDHQQDQAAQVLGIQTHISRLGTLNKELRQLILQRNDERFARTVSALKQARRQTDADYRLFIQALNAAVIIDENGARFQNLIASLAEEIRCFRHLSCQRARKNAEARKNAKENSIPGLDSYSEPTPTSELPSGPISRPAFGLVSEPTPGATPGPSGEGQGA